MTNTKRLLAMAVAAAVSAPMSVLATNGMNMDGYGPIATAMGGASMAYDNGTAAMMNNPATLGLAEEGSRLDVALGFLGPDVDASAMGMEWPSKADSFYMPAIGYSNKSGNLTYGVGAFAQGGMGTDYPADMSTGTMAPGAAFVFAPTSMMGGGLSPTSSIAGTVMGWEEFSQVGVARILFPVSFNVGNNLTIGASVDFVRASMDLQMAMAGGMMADMMPGGSQSAGTISGSMISGLQAFMAPGDALYGGYFDFADDNDFSGATTGDGFAGKLGFTYKVNNKLSLGATYHSETSLDDLTGGATVSMAMNLAAMGGTDMVMDLNGDMTVKDFQWPATYALGLSYQASDKLMVAADIKTIKWADVMKDFKMSFTANGNTGAAAAFNGTVMDAVMYQNWEDQTVYQLGVAYQNNEKLTGRIGVNIADNPIPNSTLHYLFPATIETHYTFGLGYKLQGKDEVNLSLTYAPTVTETNSMGMEIAHSQMSWQVMYSKRF